jgi:hypothetical protein
LLSLRQELLLSFEIYPFKKKRRKEEEEKILPSTQNQTALLLSLPICYF